MKTELRDPADLRRHPLHKAKVPAPDKKSKEWAAFVETVRADGRIRDAVKITPDGLVMDGWWRVEAARALQLLEVPCEINDPNEAALIMVESRTARKQTTPGATVYLNLGLLPEYADAAERRRLRNISKGRTTEEEPIDTKGLGSYSTRQEPTARYLAKRWGVSHTTILKARELRAFFHDPKIFRQWCANQKPPVECDDYEQTQAGLRDEFEALLFNGEKSLWDILQAIAGRLTTKDKPKVVRQLELFGDRFSDFITSATQLPDMKSVRPAIDQQVERFDDESHLQRIIDLGTEMAKRAMTRLAEIKKAGARPAIAD